MKHIPTQGHFPHIGSHVTDASLRHTFFESGPAPPPTPSHEDGSDGGVSLSSLLTLPATAGAGRLLYLIQRLFLFVCRNGARQMKFTVQAQRLQYRQILFTFLFPYTHLLIYRHGQAACAGEPEPLSRDLPPPTLPRFHLLGNRTGPVGIIRCRTQLIVGCLLFRQRTGIGKIAPSPRTSHFPPGRADRN